MLNSLGGMLYTIGDFLSAAGQIAIGAVVGGMLSLPVFGPLINSSLGINQPAASTVCGFGQDIGGGMCRGYLTSGSSWVVPADWNNTDNTIDAIGGGGGMASTNGGGGGAFARKINITLIPGSVISYSIGLGAGPAVGGGPLSGGDHTITPVGTGTSSGGDTWFQSPGAVLAKGAIASLGGSASASVGDLKYGGGAGTEESSWSMDPNFHYSTGGSGGGAASMYGSPNVCGTGAGGPLIDACRSTRPNGHEYDATHGSGLGGGGGYAQSDGLCMMAEGSNGGFYGGGGGGAGVDIDCPHYVSSGGGGYGTQGLIVITYRPIANATTVDPPVVPPVTDPRRNPGRPTNTPACQTFRACSVDGTKVVDNCTGSTIEDCSAHGDKWFCSGGVCMAQSMVVQPIVFESFDAVSKAGRLTATGHLQVIPSLSAPNDTVRVYWNAVNAKDCTVAGTNGDSWKNMSFSGANGQVSSPITARTVYTLVCHARTGAIPATVTERATVNTTPMWMEQ